MGSNRLGPKTRALAAATSLVVLSAVVAPPSVAAAPPDRSEATTADPVVSPEHAVADAVMGTRTGDHGGVASASDGDGFLVVWHDSSAGTVATRVSAAGEILDPGGIVIASGRNADPAVSWDGANYLVVWAHYDFMRSSWEVLSARVTPGGTVLDAEPIPIATTGYRKSPAVAFNGAHHLVVWAGSDNWSSPDVGGVRVDTAGSVVDELEIVVSAGPGEESHPAVASDGRDFLVTWTDARSGYDQPDIYGARVSAAGEVLDGEGLAIAAAPSVQQHSAVAWDGDHYLVAWSDLRNREHADVFAARVSAAGAIEGSELTVAAGTAHDRSPSVARSGAGAYVVWHDAPTEHPEYGAPPPWSVFGQQVADGAVVGSPVRIGTGTEPAAAFNGSELLVPWSVEPEVQPGFYSPANDVYAARVSAGGSLLDDPSLHLTPQANSQLEPSVAWNGRTYLVSWMDYRRSPSRHFGRLSPTGEYLDGAGIPVPGPSRDVIAASNGDGFLLVWTIGDGIAGVRIDADGTVLDPQPFNVPAASGAVSASGLEVASDGNDYFAVWRHFNTNEEYRPEVVGTRIPASGTPSGPVVPISPGQGDGPALAWNGESYLVTWIQESSDAKGPPARRGHGVAGVRVDHAGTVLDRRAMFVAADDDRHLGEVRVAAANGTFLVVWTSQPADYSPPSIEGVRVDASGRVLDRSPVALTPANLDYESPLLSWNGVHHLLAWSSGAEVLAARVSEAGTLLDPDGFVVAGAPAYGSELSLASGPHGQSAVAYVRAAPEAPYYGARRAFVRFVGTP